jgi:trehalose 6-phosphate phosphatase
MSEEPIHPFNTAKEAIRTQVEHADGLLCCTDFDGTLAPIETDPTDSEILPENYELLKRLRDTENVRVAVVSGRALTDVRERVDIEGIAYAGNHGLELHRHGKTTVHPIARKQQGTIGRICTALCDALDGIEGTAIENKSVTATVHYRKTPDKQISCVGETVDSVVSRLGGGRIHRTGGKKIFELRPSVRWNKGMVVSLLAADHEGWLPVYMGDDTTDESAFRAVSRGLPIYVGTESSNARYRISHQSEVADVLSALTKWQT